MSKLSWIIIIIATSCLFASQLSAQSFGRNKPRYKSFDFKVYETENYDIYHYFKNEAEVKRLADQSELWYDHISHVMDDDIAFKNPIIFFQSHGDFQQTNTISSTVGVTTGGVTEALKNRVTMPVTISNQKTFQVLGHELVHAFQFNIVLNGDSTGLQNLANLPLFVVEGMAEYITRGRIDPFTSMWMRDIVLNDTVPDVKNLQNPRFFPYRYGQAFWSVMVGYFGEEVMAESFREIAKYGLEEGFRRTTGLNLDELSKLWEETLVAHYKKYLPSMKERRYGKLLLDESNAGYMNLSPQVSPNGKYVVFLSEKGLFSTDLYLADTRTGKIIKKFASQLKDPDLDNLDAFESTGTWSPDSKKFAFVGFSKGRNKIKIKYIDNLKEENEFFIPGIDEINSPSWSPDGKNLLFTGLKNGQSDLYLYSLKKEKVTQLTDDMYSDIHAQWNKEGNKIVFSTDRKQIEMRPDAGPWTFDLAVYDLDSKSIKVLDIFPHADNLNPQYDDEGNIWFLSDRDGFRNIYLYDEVKDSLFQQTELLTGVSGISPYAPALSISNKRDKVVYNHYFAGRYKIYSARASAFLRKPVNRNDVDKAAGTLPGGSNDDMINTGLATMDAKAKMLNQKYDEKKYKGQMKLDHISGNTGVGISNSVYSQSTGVMGGVQMLFSDILGDHTISSVVSLNGDFQDAGLQAQYINKKRRIQWGLGISHIPNRTGSSDRFLRETGRPNEYVRETNLIRIFEDELSGILRYPINTNTRIDFTLSGSFNYFSHTIFRDFYASNNGFNFTYLGTQRERQKVQGDDLILSYPNYSVRYSKGLLGSAGLALVGDNSYFGMTSPLSGYRYRIGANYYTGLYNFTSVTADLRKYIYARPFSLAFRAFHHGRYGVESERFSPIFIGTQSLVRGVGNIGTSAEELNRYGLSVNQLLGSKILFGSFEFRLPFTGPKRLAAIKSNFLFSDLSLFLDAGAAYEDFDQVSFISKRDEALQSNGNIVMMTTGISWRVNLFGALILEPYYAIPLREKGKGNFGLNFLLPGF